MANTESEWVQSRLHQYMSEQPCATCGGTRLKKEALAVRLHTTTKIEESEQSHELHSAGPSCAARKSAESNDGDDANRGTGFQPVRAVNESEQSVEIEPIESQSRRHGLKTRATKNGNSASPAPALPGYSIDDVARLTVGGAKEFFQNLRLSEEGITIAEPIVREISARLGFMVDVGLGYLTLDRKTGSLSGGEAQRIRLATQVGSGLVGVCYVLDEP